jgi:N-acetylglucosaminyl-diphospho-decaprenol L-rhamnosyltransferase
MTLSVVIVTWNSQDHIASCLASVQKQGRDLSGEIIVVDNNSDDGTREIISRAFPAVRVFAHERNLGFTRACNRGLAECRGEYVLLLNPDTEVMFGSLHKMVQYMEAHSQVGALGPQLLFPDGRVQPSCRQFPSYGFMLWEFTGLRIAFPRSRIFGGWRMGSFDHRQLRTVDQPMGACLLLRRSLVEEIGLLDEQFEMFFSDVDLCRRVKEAGWKIIFLPSAQVVHHVGASVRTMPGRMMPISHGDCYRYFKKYRRRLLDYPASWMLGLGLLLSLPVRVLGARLRLAFCRDDG